jgi:hypothetical protein
MDTKTYLGRCPEKGCKSALWATEADVEHVDDWKGVKAPFVVYHVGNWGRWAKCPNGHKNFKMHTVKGTFSDKHTCDARCMNAKGHECTCSCGGANHGRGYAAPAPSTSNTASTVNEFIGEVGKTIRGTATVEGKRELRNGSILYTFRTKTGSVIKWFVPGQYDPNFDQTSEVTFRAKVKAHDEGDFGKSTIVTYLEEVE